MLDAEALVPTLRETAHPLQRLQQLTGFLADFLSVHFHA
ncbi:unnamed protein product, partial [marine sediment metagenome]